MNYKIVDLNTGMFVYTSHLTPQTIYMAFEGEYAIYTPSNLKVPARRHSDYWRRVY